MELHTALKELELMLREEVLRRMRSSINAKTNTPTLIGSDLEHSVATVQTSEESFAFQIADYWQYVAYGRKAGAKLPPIEAILNWIRRKGIRFEGRTENQTAWAIAIAIQRDGIQGRPFMGSDYNIDDTEKVLPYLDGIFDNWAEKLFNLICDSLKYFK